jgi:hypothetical protein
MLTYGGEQVAQTASGVWSAIMKRVNTNRQAYVC